VARFQYRRLKIARLLYTPHFLRSFLLYIMAKYGIWLLNFGQPLGDALGHGDWVWVIGIEKTVWVKEEDMTLYSFPTFGFFWIGVGLCGGTHKIKKTIKGLFFSSFPTDGSSHQIPHEQRMRGERLFCSCGHRYRVCDAFVAHAVDACEVP
jgi:hypothetical protein